AGQTVCRRSAATSVPQRVHCRVVTKLTFASIPQRRRPRPWLVRPTPRPVPRNFLYHRGMLRRISLTSWIFIALVVGVVIGAVWPHFGVALNPLEVIFLRLIKMIVGPLIFATLVVGIAGHGDLKGLGRVAVKAIVFFEVVTTFALILGLLAVNWVRPGAGASLGAAQAGADLASTPAHQSLMQSLILHTFPQSFAQALANGEVLQVVVFSVLFAIALVLAG